MCRFSFVLILFSCHSFPGFGQDKPATRYKDPLFSRVTVQKNIVYQSGPQIKKKYGLLDLYQAESDSAVARPLIIWIHGGGFKFGKKTSRGTPLWCRDFAKRGYVCASINYRLSAKNPLSNFPALAEGCYDAVKDAGTAIRFFKQHREIYRIDTTKIILAGNSAGGMVALQSAYSSLDELAELAQDSMLNPASAAYNPDGIAAVINYWGAVFNTSWLAHARVPIVSVQGSGDRVVPYDHKAGQPLYGSFAIRKKSDSLHIPNRLKTYEGFGHELQRHFNPLWAGPASIKRFHEASRFAAGFLYDELFKQALQ